MAEPREEPAAHTGVHRWLNLRGLDAAKAGLALYIVGMVTSGIYYARFHVLALDFTRIQSIVVGVYLIVLYLAAPAGAVWCVRLLGQHRALRVLVFVAMVAGFDAGLLALIGVTGLGLALGTATTMTLQVVLFLDWKALWANMRDRRLEIEWMHQPTRARLVGWGVLICLHFSVVWFPRIPGNFAGGKPIYVQVFTATAGLPDSRFASTKDKPQINSQMDSYSLWLLYQTDTDVYLLDSLPAQGTLVDDDVMRITQDQVIRMDYNTAPQ
jgi:hypothetical protein